MRSDWPLTLAAEIRPKAAGDSWPAISTVEKVS